MINGMDIPHNRPKEDAIEVTPQVIDAGIKAFEDYDSECQTLQEFLTACFKAMYLAAAPSEDRA